MSDDTICPDALATGFDGPDGTGGARMYDAHSLYGWSESGPTLRAVRDANGWTDRGLVRALNISAISHTIIQFFFFLFFSYLGNIKVRYRRRTD